MFTRERTSALAAGISLIIMAVAAGIAYGFLHTLTVVPGDAQATALNIAENHTRFTIEVALWWLVFATDIVVSISLFVFYRMVDPSLSAVTMGFRLAYSAFLGVSIVFLTSAGSGGIDALGRIDTFDTIWSIGLIVFGVHLVLLGMLGLKSKYTPLPLAWIIIVAGLCYITVHGLYNLGEQTSNWASTIEPVLAVPMTISEIALSIWLIYRSIRSFPRNAAGS